MYRSLLVVLACCLLFVPEGHAQKLLYGTVTDAVTGEALAAANIHIEGTFRGTITNANGAYEVRLDTLPATVIVRYIGYEMFEVVVTEASPVQQDLRLQPVTYTLEEIVVTGEDPAIQIMREVIRRKQEWRATLNTYQAEAYNRFTLANDTGIVSIIETLTDAFWDKERGIKEVLKSQRQTANMAFDDALPAALFVLNLYDDDVEVGGYSLMGVTHPKALNHYDFRLEGTRYLDDQIVYDISVNPKNKLKSAFVGRVSVLDGVYALLEVALRPGKAFVYPPPINRYEATYYQQYSNYGQAYWLPVDFRADVVVQVGFSGLLSFPAFNVNQVSRFADYAINTALPDSLYEEDRVLTVDSSAVHADSLLDKVGTAVPLSTMELSAYEQIDSTLTIEQAFAPRGALARFVRDDDEDRQGGTNSPLNLPDALDLEPELWYNRVDAFHGGLDLSIDLGDRVTVLGGGGFNAGPDGADRWTYKALAEVEWGKREQGTVEVGYRAGTATRYRSDLYSRTFNSLYPLFGDPDYFDYYRNEGFYAQGSYQWPRTDLTLRAGVQAETHTSLARNTSYDLLGASLTYRENPAIQEGDLRSVTASVIYGEDFNPFGFLGQRRIEVGLEHSAPDAFGSDFDFTRYTLRVDWRFTTFFQRRFIPNALDVRLTASTFSGTLPTQRFGVVEAARGFYSPFGALRTLLDVPYEGEQHLAVFWEHNFRTIPFEIAGLRWFARKAYNLIVFGGHGRTWLSETQRATLGYTPRMLDGFHHEVGVSVSGIFGVFRLDLAKRLDQSGLTLGLGAARIF